MLETTGSAGVNNKGIVTVQGPPEPVLAEAGGGTLFD